MKKTIASLKDAFEASSWTPILYEGKLVMRALELPVAADTAFTLHVLKSSRPPEQALHVVGKNCSLAIGSGRQSKGLIWVSDWKDPIIIRFQSVKLGATFVIWNCIADKLHGPTIDSGSNFGMAIEELQPDQSWLISCSQNPKQLNANLNALIVKLERTKISLGGIATR